MTSAPSGNSSISHLSRSRTPSHLSFGSPQSHRLAQSKIVRSRSSSALSFNESNRKAIWEEAVGLTYRSNDIPQGPSTAPLPIPEALPSSSRSVPSLSSSVSSSSSFPPFDYLSAADPFTTTSQGPAISLLSSSLTQSALRNSMEFMMPAQYNHFGTFPSSYTSNYLDQYSTDETNSILADASSENQSNYAASYTTTPPLIRSSPAHSPRPLSEEREAAPSYPYQYPPYQTSPSLATSAAGYPYADAHGSMNSLQYTSGYAPSTDVYSQPSYGMHYGQQSAGYSHQQAAGYPSYGAESSAASSTAGAEATDPSGVRVVNERAKPQCWEHGCNGRQFSTFSNLLRHQRERAGTAAKPSCPRCGAVFTRTTARNGHMTHDKCKRKSAYSTSEAE